MINHKRHKKLTINGVTKTILEWSLEPGAACKNTIQSRHRNGRPDYNCVFDPVAHHGRTLTDNTRSESKMPIVKTIGSVEFTFDPPIDALCAPWSRITEYKLTDLGRSI